MSTRSSAPVGTAESVQWLDTPRDLAALGGKARPLVTLLQAGLPVPPAFVVHPSVFPTHAPEHANQSHLSDLAVEHGPAQTRRQPAAPVTEQPANTLSPEVREQITTAYTELGRRVGQAAPRVAVRSSAAAEDLDGASFAGQYETYLGVQGAEAVLAAVLRCWESLWSAHAVSYRAQVAARRTEPLPPPAMAVLVQVLVEADAAGVAFTADPFTGDDRVLIINATWGLGQSVVDGEVETDTWQVDRHTRAIVAQTTGHKPARTGLGADAAPVPIPEELQDQPCLTPAQVVQVAELAWRAEQVIGGPADVEWALAGGTVWLLQARPITTGARAAVAASNEAGIVGPEAAPLAYRTGRTTAAPAGQAPTPPAPTPPDAYTAAFHRDGAHHATVRGPTSAFPFVWPNDDAPTLHWRLNEVDGQAIPARPLELAVHWGFAQSSEDAAAIRGSDRISRTLQLHGYQYSAQAPSPVPEDERWRRKQAFERPAIALHERGETYFRTVIFPEVDAGNERLAALDLDQLDAADLVTQLEEAFAWYRRSWSLHWLWPPRGPVDRFIEVYKEITGDAQPDAARELLAHEPNLLTEAIDGLLELADLAQRAPAVRALFERGTPAEILDALRAQEAPDGSAAFCTRFEQLLAQQGLRNGNGFGAEQDHSVMVSWHEDPTLVIALVQKYVPQDLAMVRAGHVAAVARRDARVAAIREQITDSQQRESFDFWLAAGRRAAQDFEDHNYKIDSAATSLLHRAIMACGRRLAQASILAEPDEVWWLEQHEVAAALKATEADPASQASDAERQAGTSAPAVPQWAALIQSRRALYRWQQSLTPPKTLGAPPPAKPAEAPKPTEAPPLEPPPTILVQGQTGSAGIATGRIRLLDRNTLVPDVERGDVLVAHNAGPVWTPVFPMVAAVVLDEGALFQHAMLTCREYGVPAVFQTKQATKKLREGQRVTVDATNGWVLPAE